MKTFARPGAFAVHLTRLAAISRAVTHRAADKGGAEIAKTARGMIGHYQRAVGPYPAWAPLADVTEQRKAAMGYEPDAPLLASGEMQASIGHQTKGATSVAGAADRKMLYHELGTEHIPPRPVFGPAAIHAQSRIKPMLAATLVAWVSGGNTVNPRRPRR